LNVYRQTAGRSEDRPYGVLTLQRCLFGPANRTWRRSWHPSYGTAPLPAQPLTGFFACALAFSTLLSSQGADAHHPRLFKSHPGQPYELTRTATGCQPSSGTDLVLYSSCTQHTLTLTRRFPGAKYLGGCPAEAPVSGPPDWLPAGPRGQDETLGSIEDQVKSGSWRAGSRAISTPPTVRFPRRSTR
jgi:hypothetical protein